MAEEKREIVKENYSKLQKKRKKALDALEGNVSIIVNKENIVHDLISVYKDPSRIEHCVNSWIYGYGNTDFCTVNRQTVWSVSLI